jgi:WD40 repeat protein
MAPPRSPFKGLAAFQDSDLDALFFFGREGEREVLVANLLAARLPVLYGESGVGKSSLLGAGVVRALREIAPDAEVALRNTWSGPIDDVLDDVRDGGESYLILDQFEEYFLYHSDADENAPGTLLHDLPELLRDSRVNVLISLREDSLARLDAFKARIPSVFANQVRLEHLDRDAARDAILGPIQRWNELTDDEVDVETALVDAVLDEVSAGRVDGLGSDRDRIEAPYLQLVLERMWDAEHAEGSSTLRLSTLRSLGGAASIVREHLQGALDALDGGEQNVAASMFEHLVTPSGTKIAHRVSDLAEYADVPEDRLRRVLAELTRDRIVHSVDGSDRYEIFHDVLAEPIRAWRQQRRLDLERVAARRRQRRLYVFSAATLVALAVVAGLAVWAFSERGSARSQARHARAGILEATALQQLPIDPSKSVSLALAAAQLEPGVGAESVLRQALTEDRQRLRVRVGGNVEAVAISPDRRLLAASAPGDRVLVLDLQDNRVVHTLRAPGGAAALRFPDRAVLVATSPHGVVTAWTLGAGRREVARSRLRGALAREAPRILQVVRTHGFVAARVKESGGHIRARIFDSRGRLLHVLPEIGINDLDFSPDGRLLATASELGFTTLWNTRTSKRVRRIPDSSNGVTKVAFSPDGTLLASGGNDDAVRVWTVKTGERLYFFTGHQKEISALSWSPDSRLLASGSADRTVRLWAVQHLIEYGSLVAALAGNDDTVLSIAFSEDGRRLVTGSADGTARVWDARPEEELRLLGRARGPMIAARWAGNTIAAASADGTLQLFDAQKLKRTHVLNGPKGATLTSLAVSGDGSVVVAGASNGATIVWDGRTGKRLVKVGGHSGVLAVAVSPNGELAASGDKRGLVRVWDARTGRLHWVARQRGGEVSDVEFSPDGSQLVTSSPAGAVVWSSANGRALHRLAVAGGVVRAVFSPDAKLIGGAGYDGTERLWFAGTGDPYRILRGHRAALTDLAFSPDGVLLATSSHDADGRVWNVATGRRVHLLRGHGGSVAAIAFSPNRRWIATAGPISVGLWPMSTGRILFYLRGHKPLLTGVSFSPDGHTILSTSTDGTVRTYMCEVCGTLDSLVRLGERRLARGG